MVQHDGFVDGDDVRYAVAGIDYYAGGETCSFLSASPLLPSIPKFEDKVGIG